MPAESRIHCSQCCWCYSLLPASCVFRGLQTGYSLHRLRCYLSSSLLHFPNVQDLDLAVRLLGNEVAGSDKVTGPANTHLIRNQIHWSTGSWYNYLHSGGLPTTASNSGSIGHNSNGIIYPFRLYARLKLELTGKPAML